MNDTPQTAKSGQSLLLPVLYVTTLFFIWAVVTNLLDPLLRNVKAVFTLSLLEANLTGFAFFIGYGVMSMPSAAFLSKFGYAKSVMVGLGGIVAGCLIAILGVKVGQYPLVLAALFTMASGIALLQVAANPLIASLGTPDLSAFRLNLSQSFNSLGAALGLYFGSTYLLQGALFEKGVVITEEMKSSALGFVSNIYLAIAVALAIFIGMIYLVRKRIDDAAPTSGHAISPLTALNSKWALLGALGIFLYVGAEVAISLNMIPFLEQAHILNVGAQAAGQLTMFYMLFAMIGRFTGSALLRFIKGTDLLAFCGIGAAALCIFIIANNGLEAKALNQTFTVPLMNITLDLTTGAILGLSALLIGLFNSIMFPTIFTLTLERSTAATSATSGLLCMAIVGGAFLPLAFAHLSEMMGNMAFGFIAPLLCYAYVLWFALAAKKAPTHAIEEGAVGAGH